MRVLSFLIACLATTLSFADSLNVPGSLPGTTQVFATDRGITVGTYEIRPDVDFGPFATYGFYYDGQTYETFTSPVQGRYAQINITDFSRRGGITYYYNNPVEALEYPHGVVNNIALRQFFPFNQGVTSFDGSLRTLIHSPIWIPTDVNDAGQFFGYGDMCFDEVACDRMEEWSREDSPVIKPRLYFLISDSDVFFNYTRWDGAEIVNFKLMPDAMYSTAVPEPATGLGAGALLLIVACLRRSGSLDSAKRNYDLL